MAVKRYKQRKSSLAARVIVVGCASCLLVGCIGFGFASAGIGASGEDTFGIESVESSSSPDSVQTLEVSDSEAHEPTVLTNVATRDISQGIRAIELQEENDRRAAEEAKRAEEASRIAIAEAAKAQQQAVAGQESASSALSALSDVDWSMGRDAFVAEWTVRIDAYLAGSPLGGQGATFATAAWNNGIDPRWSPAISNTESSKGARCFLSHNAWGWGSTGWSSWGDAINAHVAGLAANYGYSITYSSAMKYCPPNADHWFNATLNQMKMI